MESNAQTGNIEITVFNAMKNPTKDTPETVGGSDATGKTADVEKGDILKRI